MNSFAGRMVKSDPGHGRDSWIAAEDEAHTIDTHGRDSSMLVIESDGLRRSPSPSQPLNENTSERKLGFGERAVSAAGAAFLSAIIVNPLDVAKVMLNQSFLCY